MSATEDILKQVIDHAITLLKTTNINDHSWDDLKVLKPYIRENTIGVAMCRAEDEVRRTGDPAYWRKPDGMLRRSAFTKGDQQRVEAAVERVLKREAADDKARKRAARDDKQARLHASKNTTLR